MFDNNHPDKNLYSTMQRDMQQIVVLMLPMKPCNFMEVMIFESRDFRVHQILEGTNEIMKFIISKNLLK